MSWSEKFNIPAHYSYCDEISFHVDVRLLMIRAECWEGLLDRTTLSRAFESERAVVIDLFENTQSSSTSALQIPAATPFLLKLTGIWDYDELQYIKLINQAITNINTPNPNNPSTSQQMSQVPPVCIITHLVLPALDTFHSDRFVGETTEALLTTAIVIKRYQIKHPQLPANLETIRPFGLPTNLTDPYTQNTIRLIHTDSFWTIYSGQEIDTTLTPQEIKDQLDALPRSRRMIIQSN